jgi:hypothetical protein
MNLKSYGGGGGKLDSFCLDLGPMIGCCERSNELSCSIKCRECLGYLNGCQLIRRSPCQIISVYFLIVFNSSVVW